MGFTTARIDYLGIDGRGQHLTLLRRHPDRAVEPDHFPVEHLVADDLADERSELFRATEPRRERYRLAQRFGDVHRNLAPHGRLEDARGDRHDADPDAAQLAGDRERPAD